MNKDLITLIAVTLLTVIAWIAFEAYHSKTNVYVLDEVAEFTEPLNPELDTNFIESLKEKETF